MDQSGQPIVVIGASAGGVQALSAVVSGLPPNFPGAVCVVVHIGARPSVLPSLLGRAGALPASHALDGEPIRPGHIYVAPPDHHLLVRDHHLVLSRGPRENHSRPAIDPLFRSAARSYGPRAVGIILSGALNDGTAGLLALKARGGTAIVQDPADALIGGMPESALRTVDADYVLPAAEIGLLLGTLRSQYGHGHEVDTMARDPEFIGEMIREDFAEQGRDERIDQLTMYTCPDCGGTLWQVDSGELLRFQCHVGHAWGPEALLDQKSEELEAALWASVRLLEERATLTRQVAVRLRETHASGERAESVDEQAGLDEQRADLIRELLQTPLDEAFQAALGPGEATAADVAESGRSRSHPERP